MDTQKQKLLATSVSEGKPLLAGSWAHKAFDRLLMLPGTNLQFDRGFAMGPEEFAFRSL